MIYSEVRWDIDIDQKLLITHKINISVFNVESTLPSIHERLNVILPRDRAFSKFETAIDGQSMMPGFGYDPPQNLYSLMLSEIRKNAKKTPTQIKVSFEESGATQRCSGGLCYYYVNFMPRFYQSAMTLRIKTPSTKSSWGTSLARMFCRATSAPELPPVQFLGREPTCADGNAHVFNFRDDYPPFGILFTSRYLFDRASLILGAVGGIIISAIGSWIVMKLFR